MENRILSKTTVVNGLTYQINKLDARSSCWLFTFISSRSVSEGAFLSVLGKCTRAEFDEIQTLALSKVLYLDSANGVTLPSVIISSTGAVVDPNLVNDAESLMRLTTESLLFSLSPFLVERGSSSLAP
jgi:hypothetical protein